MTVAALIAAKPTDCRVTPRAAVADATIVLAVCSTVLLGCLLYSPEFHHWFVLPVLACGALVGMDAIKWLRGDVDVFDPVGQIGLLGIHFFFLAPLLHVATQYWMGYIIPPDDWRPWLGYMACLNVAGLVIYRVSRRLMQNALPAPRIKSRWEIDPRRFGPFLTAALIATAVLQLGVYAAYGGISGYIDAYTDTRNNFTGMGIVFMFSEAFPILMAFAAVYWARKDARRRTLLVVFAILAAFVACKIVFGGLRGSRGLIIYGLYWAAGIIHLMMYPLPRRLMYVGGVFLVAFMYAYGFYKSFGADSIRALEGSQARADLLEVAPRTFDAVLLLDLARSDVQAFELYRLSLDWRQSRYNLYWGETYLGALSLAIPRPLLELRWPKKNKAGTDLLFGPGVFENDFIGSNAYGVTGEAMLNFGIVGGLMSFVVLAGVVEFARRWFISLPRDDARTYLLPFLLSLTFMVLLWDSDVVFFYIIKEGFFPTAVLFASIRRIPLPAVEERGHQA